MENLNIMKQPQTEPKYLCSIMIPLTVDNTSPFYKYYDAGSKTWSIPVGLLPNRYRFRLTRVDPDGNFTPNTDFTLVCDQLKMLYSPAPDFIMNINALAPYFTPIVHPIDFVGSVSGVLTFGVWTQVYGIQPTNFLNVNLFYNVYLE
jgi:hypothetical protein